MLNSQFIFEQSDRFAARVMQAAGPDETKRIETVFRLALAREPTAEERTLSRVFIRKQVGRYRQKDQKSEAEGADAALVNLCQMLFNTNEFLYVE